MALRIGSNPSQTTLFAQRQLARHTRRAELALERLASGRRINRAADGPAELAIAEGLRARARSVAQARRNSFDGLSMAQVGEGALAETSGLLIRIRELAVQSANGTLGDAERASLGREAESLLEEVDRIAATTRFAGRRLLDGTATLSIVTGADADDVLDLPSVDATRSALGLDGVDLGLDASAAASAFDELDRAIEQVAAERGRLGTSMNVLESRIRQSLNEEENLRAAESRIVDTDFAEETAALAQAQLLQQTTIAVLAQERIQSELVLELLEAATEAA